MINLVIVRKEMALSKSEILTERTMAMVWGSKNERKVELQSISLRAKYT